MSIGDTVTLTIDIVQEITATGRIVTLANHYIIIETDSGERKIGNRLNAKPAQ